MKITGVCLFTDKCASVRRKRFKVRSSALKVKAVVPVSGAVWQECQTYRNEGLRALRRKLYQHQSTTRLKVSIFQALKVDEILHIKILRFYIEK